MASTNQLVATVILSVVISSAISASVANSIASGSQANYNQFESSMQSSYSQLQAANSNLLNSANNVQSATDSVNNQISTIQASLANLSSTLNTMSGRIDNQAARLNAISNLDVTNALSTAQQLSNTLRAYRDMKQYMIGSGSGLATTLASTVVNDADTQGLIPGVLHDQIKGAMIPIVAGLLKEYLPTSAWTEYSTASLSATVYSTSLETSIPLSVSVLGVSINPFRIIVIATSDVDISSDTVSNLTVESIQLVTL
jgi:hypothetical protein